MAALGTWMEFAGWFSPFWNGLIFAFGVPGNILTLRVFTNRHLHQFPVCSLLAGLTAADLLVCLCRMVVLYLSLARDFIIQDHGTLTCRISDASLYFSVYATLFLLSAVAFDHYVATCKPTGFQITLPLARILAASCFISAIMLSCALPFFGEYDGADGAHLCRITSPLWLTDLRFYSLLCFTFAAASINALLYALIFRAIRRQVRVESNGRNRSCLSLISAATRLSLNFPQIPSLGGPPPVLPPRLFGDGNNLAAATDESLACSSHTKGENPNSEDTNERVYKLKEQRGRRKVRFNDSRAKTRCPKFSVAEPLQHPSLRQPARTDSNIAKMVFAKALTFSFVWIPLFVLMSLEHFRLISLDGWLDICLDLVLVNSALNMFIFALASPQFRADYKDLFRGIRCFWEPRSDRPVSHLGAHP